MCPLKSLLKNSGYKESEGLCIKLYFLVFLKSDFEPSKIRNGLLSCLGRDGCEVVHAEAHTVSILLIFQQDDLQQQRLPLPVLCFIMFSVREPLLLLPSALGCSLKSFLQ